MFAIALPASWMSVGSGISVYVLIVAFVAILMMGMQVTRAVPRRLVRGAAVAAALAAVLLKIGPTIILMCSPFIWCW